MNTLTFNELEHLINLWADERGIANLGETDVQFVKVREEFMEVIEAFDHNFPPSAKRLEIGDALVTLILLARTMGTNVSYCLEQAYEKIKDRKGRVINGFFVKAEDLHPENLDAVADEDS